MSKVIWLDDCIDHYGKDIMNKESTYKLTSMSRTEVVPHLLVEIGNEMSQSVFFAMLVLGDERGVDDEELRALTKVILRDILKDKPLKNDAHARKIIKRCEKMNKVYEKNKEFLL